MRQTPVSYYDVLQITPQASDEDVKRAFRRLALHHHPDRNPKNRALSEVRFQLISKAYEALRTSESRAAYDYTFYTQSNPKKETPQLKIGKQRSLLAELSAIFKPQKKSKKKTDLKNHERN